MDLWVGVAKFCVFDFRRFVLRFRILRQSRCVSAKQKCKAYSDLETYLIVLTKTYDFRMLNPQSDYLDLLMLLTGICFFFQI